MKSLARGVEGGKGGLERLRMEIWLPINEVWAGWGEPQCVQGNWEVLDLRNKGEAREKYVRRRNLRYEDGEFNLDLNFIFEGLPRREVQQPVRYQCIVWEKRSELTLRCQS